MPMEKFKYGQFSLTEKEKEKFKKEGVLEEKEKKIKRATGRLREKQREEMVKKFEEDSSKRKK